MNLNKNIRKDMIIFGILLILIFNAAPFLYKFSYKARNDINEKVNTIRTASGNTWTVDDDGPADFNKIQDAIDVAASGDDIIVNPGIYEETLKIPKSLKIHSSNGPEVTIIKPSTYGDVIRIENADFVGISGFKFDCGRPYVPQTVFYMFWSHYVNISNNIILDSRIGAEFIQSDYLTFTENVIMGYQYYGIRLDSCYKAHVFDNKISGGRGGTTIYIDYSSDCLISNNILLSTDPYGYSTKISLLWGSNNIIENNKLVNFGYLYLQGCINNVIRKNSKLILKLINCENNRIYCNNFESVISIENALNIWESSEQITYFYNGETQKNFMGNYWVNYYGNDLNNDGIGDIPYIIDSYNQDLYPLIEPFENYFKLTGLPKFLILPFREAGIIVQQGWRYNAPIGPNPEDPYKHEGIDYIKKDEQNNWLYFDVVAAAEGEAIWSEGGGYGKFILIKHYTKDSQERYYYTLYSHLEDVFLGQEFYYDYNKRDNWNDQDWNQITSCLVELGELIGKSGASGVVGHPDWIHLHFEVDRGGYTQDRLDPYDLYTTREYYYPGGELYDVCGTNYLWTKDPPLFMQISVNAIELDRIWRHNPIDSLPLCKSTIKYFVLNLGYEELNNVKLIMRVDGNIVDQKIIPIISKGEAFIDMITLDIAYDSSKDIEITASIGPIKEIYTNTFYAILPRKPYGGIPELETMYQTRVFITPTDPIVKNTLDDILASSPSWLPDWMAIKDWVGSKIKYEPDNDFDLYHFGVEEYFQLPRETIQKTLGDCEDQALLLCSLLRANGWDPEEVYVVLGYTQIDGKDAWHAWVRIKIGLWWYSIEPTWNLPIAIINGEHFKLSGFNAMFMFNDIQCEKIGYVVKSFSPVDIIIKDPDGLIISKDYNEIPNAYYCELDLNGDGDLDDQIRIPDTKLGTYEITIIPEQDALPTDTYSVEIVNDGINYVIANDIKIENIPDQPYVIDASEEEIIPIIPTTIDFDPDTLYLQSSGKWVTVYIELPIGHGYDISEINIESVMLNDQIYANIKPNELGDYDLDGIPDLMVKFELLNLQEILQVGEEVSIIITGKLEDERTFRGEDVIRVISHEEIISVNEELYSQPISYPSLIFANILTLQLVALVGIVIILLIKPKTKYLLTNTGEEVFS